MSTELLTSSRKGLEFDFMILDRITANFAGDPNEFPMNKTQRICCILGGIVVALVELLTYFNADQIDGKSSMNNTQAPSTTKKVTTEPPPLHPAIIPTGQ